MNQRRKPQSDPPHVACIVETSMAFGREILWGVARYVGESGPWTVYIEQRSLTDQAPPWLATWDGDGIISRLTPSQTRRLAASGIPIVDLNDQGPGPCRPHIRSDHRAEGALAAEHLLERGFTSFAFFGYPHFAWSRECRDGFSATLEAAGYSCRALSLGPSGSRGATSSRPGRWRSRVSRRGSSRSPSPWG